MLLTIGLIMIGVSLWVIATNNSRTQDAGKFVIGKYNLPKEIKAKLTVDAPKDRKEFNEWFMDIHNMRNGKI